MEHTGMAGRNGDSPWQDLRVAKFLVSVRVEDPNSEGLKIESSEKKEHKACTDCRF